MSGVSTIADIPSFLPSSASDISDAKVPSASTADRAPLQQRSPFSRWRRTHHFISTPVTFEDFEIFLESLPTDVAGMSVRNASQPITVFTLSLDLLLAIDSPAIMPASVNVGARVSRIV